MMGLVMETDVRIERWYQEIEKRPEQEWEEAQATVSFVVFLLRFLGWCVGYVVVFLLLHVIISLSGLDFF
jgi:hypothetical protein